MGTDIHCCAEVQGADGTWKKLDGKPFPHPYYRADEERWNGPEYQGTNRVFYNRNYDLFAILANVRNGSGFAGVDTGDGFNVIAADRGLPDDIDQEGYRLPEDWVDRESLTEMDLERYDDMEDLGDHSFTWMLLQELLDFDWEQVTTHRGWVDYETWKKWHDGGRKGGPDGWSGGISGAKIVHMVDADHTPEEIIAKHEEVDAKRDPKTDPKKYFAHNLYIQLEWTETYRESVGEYVFERIEMLKQFGPPDKVRLVMGFDS